MKFIKTFVLSILSMTFLVNAVYAGPAVDKLKKAVDNIISIVSAPENKGDENIKKRRDLLRTALEESFDYQEMGKRSLGRQWSKLSEKERGEYIELITMLLKTSYIKKIEGYKNEKIEYVSDNEYEGKYAICKTVIHTDTNDIPVDYKMIMTKDSGWMVYDFTIEGVSLVANYRIQFGRVISREGVDGLLNNMRNKIKDIHTEEKT